MGKKYRIACLHGFGTNAKFLERQMKSFKRAFNGQMQFVFIDGPFSAPKQFILDEKVLQMIEGEPKSWFPFISHKERQKQFLQLMLSSLNSKLCNQKFDGLLGFSQGGGAVHMILSFYRLGIIQWEWVKEIKLCIMVCGIFWSWKELQQNLKQIKIPSIHLVSSSDFIYLTSLLGSCQFQSPLVIEHSFGHSFPRMGQKQISLIKTYIQNEEENVMKTNATFVSKL